MSDTDYIYKSYRLTGLPLGVFGETYIVVATSDSRFGGFSVEYYILSSRPKESMRTRTLEVYAKDLPEELGVVDADFAINEGLRQAEVDIIQMLEERSIELNRPGLAILPFKIQEDNIPFVGFRMRGQFLNQLEDILRYTKCQRLARYMDLLHQVRPIL